MPPDIVIGLVLPLHLESGQHILRGVLRYVDEHPEIRLMDLCFTKDDGRSPRQPAPWRNRADGVVLHVGKTPGIVEHIQSGGVPAVNAGADLLDTPIASVFTDGASLARVGIGHLCSLGFHSIACVGFGRGSERRKALADELKKRGRKLHAAVERSEPYLWNWPDETVEASRRDRAIAELIETAEKPLGIFAYNDFVGVATCRVVESLKLRIPEDVGVLGVGDTGLANISSPPLSTIRAPHDPMGYEATRLVHRMIEGRRLKRLNVPVPGVELIARTSTIGNHRAVRADIQNALGVIRHRACEGVTVVDIAAELHMSVRRLEIQFAAAVGRTVGEELRRVRLARAEELLANTDLSLTRVADLVGCNDSAYLTNLFRRKFNLTPSQYRKQKTARK